MNNYPIIDKADAVYLKPNTTPNSCSMIYIFHHQKLMFDLTFIRISIFFIYLSI